MRHVKKIGLAFLTLSIATFLLYWCFRQVDLALFWQELAHARYIFLALALLSVTTIIFFNAGQWLVLLPENRRIRFRTTSEIVAISLMTANTVPWGHAAAVYFLGRIKRVGHTVALSVLTLEQLFGGLSKVIVYLIVVLIVPLPPWWERAALSFVGLVLGLYVVLLVLAHRHRELKVREEEAGGWWSRVVRTFVEWAHYLHAVRDWRRKGAGIGYGLLMRTGEAMAFYWVQLAFGVDLPFWSVWLLVMAVNLAIMFPVTPGNLGVYEATVFYVYKYLGVESTLAMTLAVFSHVVYLIPAVIPGYLLMIRRGIRIRQVLARPESKSLYTQDTLA